MVTAEFPTIACGEKLCKGRSWCPQKIIHSFVLHHIVTFLNKVYDSARILDFCFSIDDFRLYVSSV